MEKWSQSLRAIVDDYHENCFCGWNESSGLVVDFNHQAHSWELIKRFVWKCTFHKQIFRLNALMPCLLNIPIFLTGSMVDESNEFHTIFIHESSTSPPERWAMLRNFSNSHKWYPELQFHLASNSSRDCNWALNFPEWNWTSLWHWRKVFS